MLIGLCLVLQGGVDHRGATLHCAEMTARVKGRSGMKRVLAVVVTLGVSLVGLGSTAFAGKPGPGDKQCVPGKQGNPHPGFKAGACQNP